MKSRKLFYRGDSYPAEIFPPRASLEPSLVNPCVPLINMTGWIIDPLPTFRIVVLTVRGGHRVAIEAWIFDEENSADRLLMSMRFESIIRGITISPMAAAFLMAQQAKLELIAEGEAFEFHLSIFNIRGRRKRKKILMDKKRFAIHELRKLL
ncbi:MAG: hypothetical protein QOG91_541 [Candidatus Parcubacteria bacterium]|jgi:hypothetical protein|nr:hypothetical protein [Candidatus Parcubacteria bacterium]